MARVLVVEDEPDVAEVLNYNLQSAGFETLIAATGREAVLMSDTSRPDIILLDLMLPDIPGIQVCKSLKSSTSTKSIPVIIVSARSDEIDRVVGFEVGADDYVVKPYSMRELLLRMRRSLERHLTPRSGGDLLHSGALKLDINAHRVWVGENQIELRMTEFRLLMCLCEHPAHVLTREHLLEMVWGRGSTVALRTVDAHIKRLRDRLGAAGNQIETVRGVGYRLDDERSLHHDKGLASSHSATSPNVAF